MSSLVNVSLRSVKPAVSSMGQYAIMALHSEPVNALSTELWRQMLSHLNSLESNPSVRGLIICSTISRDIFTAGNDLRELYAPKTNLTRFSEFWKLQTEFLCRLYRSRLLTVACIGGQAPAGGCGISLCCDWRFMYSAQGKARIGLNEVQIGLMVPKYWARLFVKTCSKVGSGQAESFLLSGKMLTAEEALEVGLIDQVVTEGRKELLEMAEKRLQATLSRMSLGSDRGMELTKLLLRQEYSKEWEEYGCGGEEIKDAWRVLCEPAVVETLGQAMQKLSSSSSNKL